MNKTILALDLGTKMGWAARPRGGIIASGIASFKTNRYEGGGMRYLRFARWLDEMPKLVGIIDIIYFEEVRRHLATDAAHVYGGLLAHLTAWCERFMIPYQGVPVGAIKAHATGKGNAPKEAVMCSVVARGHKPTDDNESDALALLYWALDQEVAQ
jgi:hypothetical protein